MCAGMEIVTEYFKFALYNKIFSGAKLFYEHVYLSVTHTLTNVFFWHFS